jgi:hypothetical protein
MSSGLYSHTTRGVGTVLTAAIYNADHVNHVNNHNPSMMGGYSDSVAEMQTKTSPGGLGSEVLASSLADELQHLRYMISLITGATHWYEAPTTNLGAIGGGTALTLAFAVTPLTLRRTENNTSEVEIESNQSGSGAGNKYSRRIVGTGSNAVAEVREYLGTVEMLRRTASLLTHQIATHFNGFLGIGASGVDLVKFDPSGFFDVKQMATPANPAAEHLRFYVKNVSGVPTLIARSPSGTEVVLGTDTGVTSVVVDQGVAPTQPPGTVGGEIVVTNIAAGIAGNVLTLTVSRQWVGEVVPTDPGGGGGGGE